MNAFGVRKLAAGALAALLLLGGATASSAAPVLAGTATVTDSFSGATDVVTIGTGPELADGDGSDFANLFFFTGGGESIDFVGLTIVIRLYGGGDDLGGGFATPVPGDTSGVFTFSGLTFSPGAVITGVSASGVNVGPLTNTTGFTDTSVTFAYGGIGILQTQENLGTITLTLTVRASQDPPPPPVPEPASLALVGLGLAGVAWARRRSA